MKTSSIKERIVNEIVNALINDEPIKEFYIKLLTSSGEIDEYDITEGMKKKRVDNPKVEERFPTTRSIVLELTKHVIATQNSEYIYHFTINTDFVPKDELSDAIIKTKDYERICSFASSMLYGLKVNKFADIIAEYGETDQIYYFIDNSFADERNIFEEGDNKQEILDKLVDTFIEKNIEEKNFSFLVRLANLNIKGVSLDKLEDAIINMNKGLAIYDFAYKVENANKDKLINALIKQKDSNYIFFFADRGVKGVDINSLFDAIIKIGDDFYFDKFIREIPGLSKDKIVDGIIKMNYFSYIYQHSLKPTKKQMNRLVDAVISLGAEKIYEFAGNVNGAPVNKLANAIIETGNAEYIYNFATRIQNAPLDRLGNALISIGDPAYIFLYAKAVMGINAEKYANAVIKAGDVYWMYKFADEIKFAPVDKLENEILKLAK